MFKHFLSLLVFLFVALASAQDFSDDLSADESVDTPASSNVANASTDEWEGFNYEEVGLTQWEFQQTKESGMGRDKLLQLLEIGVRPGEYLQKPWENYGVSEADWIAERSKGMEDSDIDRTYRNKGANQSAAYLSALIPSYYQWKVGKTAEALTMDVLWLASFGAYSYLAFVDKEDNNTRNYLFLPMLVVHAWSFGDAFMDTIWETNPDANRFSWGIFPTLNNGVVGGFSFLF
jgi:hypothetical protein